MSKQSSLLKLINTNLYKLVFHETDDELCELNKETDKLFEPCSDFEYEMFDSFENLESPIQFDHNNNKLDSLKRYNKRRRRQLPKIPENKQPLSSLIGNGSKNSKIVRQISNTLSLQIELNESKKPISLLLINTEHDLKQSNESLKDEEAIDYQPLSEQLNLTGPLNGPNTNSMCSTSTSNKIEGNYRGLHRFIARHDDEISIDIGDSIYVIKQEDDLWFKGINLATLATGYFPSLYVIDCNYKELFQTVNYFGSSDDDSGLNCACSNEFDSIDLIDSGTECFKTQKEHYYLEFLASLEVAKSNGNQVLGQCIRRVIRTYDNEANKASIEHCSPFLCVLEIGRVGVHFYNHRNRSNGSVNQKDLNTEHDKKSNKKIDKKNEIDENWVNVDEFHVKQEMNKCESNSEQRNSQIENESNQDDYFFHLKNITFCGAEDNYFAFITQHPKLKNRYAAHVFKASDAQIAKDICESIGNAFHRFYLNYIELSQIFDD